MRWNEPMETLGRVSDGRRGSAGDRSGDRPRASAVSDAASAASEEASAASDRPWLDHDRCYRILESRDRRFDGRFYAAVRTTGIYCRPSCPARTPRSVNVEFLPTAAAAQVRGYRPCRRCRPDAVPGAPDWDLRADVVARAVRAIDDGVVDREGVDGLASRLGYGRRHLQRLLVAELGAGPLALARANRSRTAQVLLESSDLPIVEVAFAAGFSSIRQFNDTIRSLYGATPTELRTARRRAETATSRTASRWSGSGDDRRVDGAAMSLGLRLATRPPFAGAELLDFWAVRSVSGVEHASEGRFERTVALPHGHGVVSITLADPRDRPAGAPGLHLSVRLEDARDLAPLVRRVRRWADLDADPVAVDRVLGADQLLAPLVAAVPGRRLPGSLDVFETAVRAVVGQQISVAGARTVMGRLVEAAGAPLRIAHPVLRRVVPDAEQLAAIDVAALAMPTARRRTVLALAESVATGRIALDDAADRDEIRARLLEIPGIGPWTADYVRMRGLHDPDVLLSGDLGVRRALDEVGATLADAERWRRWQPWRSYAVHHLWARSSSSATRSSATRSAAARSSVARSTATRSAAARSMSAPRSSSPRSAVSRPTSHVPSSSAAPSRSAEPTLSRHSPVLPTRREER